MHADIFLCYEHRHFIHMLQSKSWRKKEKKKENREKKIEKKVVVFSFVFARSVSYSILYSGVALGATATRNIVVALPSSRHQQHAVASIATESKKEREKGARPRVCGSTTTSNVVLVFARVYAASRFFIVVVVLVIIHIEVNHECH